MTAVRPVTSRPSEAVSTAARLAASLLEPGAARSYDAGVGCLLGNFPQAYTHVGLIHAAITSGELLEARDGHFRAWT